MPIKIFSDLDFRNTQIKDVRLDNITDENLLTGLGEIALDTTSDNIKYKDSSGIAIIASQEWVLGQQLGVDLLNGNGTTFIDYGTAGHVDLGGALTSDATITGNFALNLNQTTTRFGGSIINSQTGLTTGWGGNAVGSVSHYFYGKSGDSNGLRVDGAGLDGNAGTMTAVSPTITGSSISNSLGGSYSVFGTYTAFTQGPTWSYNALLNHKDAAGLFISNQSANVTDYDGYMALIQYAGGNNYQNMTGSTNKPLLSVRKASSTLNGFDHTGPHIESLNMIGASGDHILAKNILEDKFRVKYDGSVYVNAGTSGNSTYTLDRNGFHMIAGTFLNLPNIEQTDVEFNLTRNVQFGTSPTLGTQRAVRILSPIYTSTIAKVINDAIGLSITNPNAGSNISFQSSTALNIESVALTNTTNGYGLRIAAPTGASNSNIAMYAFGDNILTGRQRFGSNNIPVSNIGHYFDTVNPADVSTMFVNGSSLTGGPVVQIATSTSSGTFSKYNYGYSNLTGLIPYVQGVNNVGLGARIANASGVGLTIDTESLNNYNQVMVRIGHNGNNLSVTNTQPMMHIGRTAVALNGFDMTGSMIELEQAQPTTGDFITSIGPSSAIKFRVKADGSVVANAGTSGASFNFDNNGLVIGSKVAKYLADYSAQFDANTLVDKRYVDAVAQGLDTKASVRVATTSFITLSGLQTIDGVTIIAGDRVLVKDQGTAGAFNGIYTAAAGAWTRATDFDGTPAAEVSAGAYCFIEEGTTQGDTGWVLATNDPITLGLTSLTFVQFSSAGTITASNGLTKVGPDVQMGGSFTQNTNINGNNFTTSFGVSGNTLANFKTFSTILQLDAATLKLGTLAGTASGTIGSDSISIGSNANTGAVNIGTQSVAIGASTNATAVNTVAIGTNAKATQARNVAVGSEAGNTSGSVSSDSISIGYAANQGSANIGLTSIAIGVGSVSSGTTSLAIGATAKATALRNISIGSEAGNTTGTVSIDAISIGYNSNQGTSNIGTDSVSIGRDSKTTASQNISIGTSSGNTTGTVNVNAISIGSGANAGTGDIGNQGIAIGASALSQGQGNVALGGGAQARSFLSIAIGQNAANGSTDGSEVVTIGASANSGAITTGQRSIAIGSSSRSIGSYDTTIGYNAAVTSGSYGGSAITIGQTANTGTANIGASSIAIGNASKAISTSVISIGSGAGSTTNTVNPNAISIGSGANQGTNVIGINSVAIGLQSISTSDNAVSIGAAAIVTGVESIAIGSNTKTLSDNSIAIGRYAGNTSGTYNTFAISIGYNANQGTANIGGGSIALGAAARSKGNQSISIGSSAGTTSGTDNQTSISFGYYSNSGTDQIGANSVAIGANTISATNASIAIGNGAAALDVTNGAANIAIGVAAGLTTGTTGANAISMGYQTNAGTLNIGINSIAFGNLAKATNNANISIGYLAGNNTGSIGASVITIGSLANAGSFGIGANSITIGQNANVRTQYGIAIGENSFVNGGSIAMGNSAQATGANSVAVGTSSVAAGATSTAVGVTAVTASNDSVAIGRASVSGLRSIGVGSGSGGIVTTSDFSIVLGADITSHTGTLNIGIGYGIIQNSNNSVAIGAATKANASSVIAIGDSAGNTTGTYGASAITIGSSANQGTLDIGISSVAIGNAAKSSANNNISIGTSSGNTTGTVGTNAISIGINSNQGSSNIGNSSIAIGESADATAAAAISIGQGAVASGASTSIAIGTSNIASNDSTVALGHVATASGLFATAIGRISKASSQDSISIGTAAGNTTGTFGNSIISIGRSANGDPGDTTNYGANSIAIGLQSRTKGSEGVSLGYNAGFTTGTVLSETVSIGYNANAGSFGVGIRSIAIGSGSKSQTSQSISIGFNAGNATGSLIQSNSISIGPGANAGAVNIGAGAIAIGQNAISQGDGSTALGAGANAGPSGSATAIGAGASTPGGGSGVAVGASAISAVESTSLGTSANANTNSSTAIGFISGTTAGFKGTRYITLGAYSGSTGAIGNDSIGIGTSAVPAGTESVVIGISATSDNTGAGTLAVGSYSSATGGGTAIGRSTIANGGASVAVGNSAKSVSSGTSLGYSAGNTSGSIGQDAISIGQTNSGAVNIGVRSVAIGTGNNSSGSYSVALGGQQLTTSGTGSILMGYSNTAATNSVDHSFGLVWQDTLPEYHIVKAAAQTIDNTQYAMASYPLADDNVYHMKFVILAVQTNLGTSGGADRASFTYEALCYRNAGGGATIEGGAAFNITEIKSSGANSWAATIDVLGNNVRTLVTGTGVETINWKLMLHVTRVNQ